MRKNTKRVLAVVLATMMIVACFAGCSSKSGTKGDTLKIGSTGPLTGGAASYGTSVKNGAQLAVDEINATGGVNGIKLEYMFEDDEADGAKAKSAYEKLMDQGMQVLVGAVTSGASVALNDLTKADGILQITPSGSQMECTENPNSFRVCFTDPMQGESMAKYCYETLGYKNAAIIFNQDDSYSTGIKDAFDKKFTELGGTVSVKTSFAKDANDFNAQLTKVDGSGAEFIFMPIYNDKAAQIAIAADSKGMKIPFIGCDGWDGILEKYLTGEQSALVEGALYLTPFIANEQVENVQNFVKAYQAKYNAVPDQFAADAYDAVYAVKAAMEKANITDSNDAELNSKLVAAMTEIEVDGVTGKMTWEASGEPSKSLKVAKIVNGEYVVQ